MTFIMSSASTGSHDGMGAGDNDTPYSFGRHPSTAAPFPFTIRQYARLLILRSRVEAGLGGLGDDFGGDLQVPRTEVEEYSAEAIAQCAKEEAQ